MALHRATVLVIDDDPSMREVVGSTLADEGYRVLEAENGQAALKFMEAEQLDVIISDIFMPHGDGFEVLNWIRTNARDVPVIVISGSAYHLEADFLDVAAKLGAVAVLEKPFLKNHLLEIVQRAIAGSRSRHG